MLVSIPRKLFQSVFKNTVTELVRFDTKIDSTPRKKPYVVEVQDYVLKSGKKVKVVFGGAANIPFGTISNDKKEEIGKLI